MKRPLTFEESIRNGLYLLGVRAIELEDGTLQAAVVYAEWVFENEKSKKGTGVSLSLVGGTDLHETNMRGRVSQGDIENDE